MNKQFQEVWTLITSDKKKAMALGSLALVAGGLWLRAAITSGPSKASASDKKRMTADGEKRAKKSGEKNAESDKSETVVRVIAVTSPPPLTRDLFALSDALLASSSQMDSDRSGNPKSAVGKDDKPLQSAAMRAQTLEERVQSEASDFRLRSTMIGASPIAVIETQGAKSRQSGTVVRVGEQIEGFTVIAIRARDVELEKEGVRITLSRMQ